ncbi:hypothetical protein LguiB_024065 [Lonicera macranthoides]
MDMEFYLKKNRMDVGLVWFDRGCDDFWLFGVREIVFEIGSHMVVFWRRWPEMEVEREDGRREQNLNQLNWLNGYGIFNFKKNIMDVGLVWV